MKILIVTENGNALGFAQRLSDEGHEIIVFSGTKPMDGHTGFYQVTDNLLVALRDVKFVLSDIPDWEYLNKRATMYNRPVIGCNLLATMANKDAIKQHDLCTRYKLPTPETRVFEDLSEAITGAADWDAAQTIIKYDDKIFRCEYKDWVSWGMMKIPLGKKFIFQRWNKGLEVTVNGWFDGLEWLDAFSVGPGIDPVQQFDMVAQLNKGSALISPLLDLTDFLKRTDYHGPVHMDLIVNEHAIYVYHIHVGFKFPMDYTILDLIKDDLGTFLNGVATSNNFKVDPTSSKYVAAVQSQCVGENFGGAPIFGLNSERLKHIVFHDVAKQENDYMLTDGGHLIATAVARGNSAVEVSERVYQTVSSVKFPEKHFNGNLLGLSTPILNKLADWSYLNG